MENGASTREAEYSFRMDLAAVHSGEKPSARRLLGWRLDVQRWTILGLQRLSVRLGHAPKKPRHLLTGERGGVGSDVLSAAAGIFICGATVAVA